MSNFTDFFPVPSSGVSKDPKDLSKSQVGHINLFLKTAASTWRSVYQTAFWTAYGGLSPLTGAAHTADEHKLGRYITVPTSGDAYQTIADIENTNGGYLCNVISPIYRNTMTNLFFKITIDDVATEIEVGQIDVSMQYNNTRFLLGGFIPGGGDNTDGSATVNTANAWQYYTMNYNGFWTTGTGQKKTLPSNYLNSNHIKFDSKCKVEVKCVGTVGSSNLGLYTGALIIQN